MRVHAVLKKGRYAARLEEMGTPVRERHGNSIPWPADGAAVLMGERFQVDIRGLPVTVEIRRNTRRRTRVGMSFRADGSVCVDAPPGLLLDEVRSIVMDHSRWVRYRSERAVNEVPYWYPEEYLSGSMIRFLGATKELEFCRDDASYVEDQGPILRVHLSDGDDAKAAVWSWYNKQAGTVLAGAMEEAVTRIPWVDQTPRWRHSFMRSQWGSCSVSGRISLNTHLIKLARELTSYVITHELCHLVELNHGPAFNALMDRHVPDWRSHREAINRVTGLLSEEKPVRGLVR